MSAEVEKTIEKLRSCFSKGFTNYNNEFVADRLANKKYGSACFSLNNCESTEDVTCAAIEFLSYDCCKSRPFTTPAANVDFRIYMIRGMNQFLGTSFTELDFVVIYTHLGCAINRMRTREFIESGFDLLMLKRMKTEKIISADRLLETLNGLEYRARTLEQMRGGNDVLRKLLPKVINEQKTMRMLQLVTCERCQYWIPEKHQGRCSLSGRVKRRSGYCDEGKEKD